MTFIYFLLSTTMILVANFVLLTCKRPSDKTADFRDYYVWYSALLVILLSQKLL